MDVNDDPKDLSTWQHPKREGASAVGKKQLSCNYVNCAPRSQNTCRYLLY